MLKWQLFGYPRHFSRTVPQYVFVSSDVSLDIVDSVYKRDGFSIVNNILTLLNKLITTRRGDNEPFDKYESRFTARPSKFNS